MESVSMPLGDGFYAPQMPSPGPSEMVSKAHGDRLQGFLQLLFAFPEMALLIKSLIFRYFLKHAQIATDATKGEAGGFRANLARPFVKISVLF